MSSVTVITPIYNRRKYVEAMVKMLQMQTLPNIEFVIVDDGSTDDTFELLQKTICNDKRFILLKNQSNLGPSATRNLALQKASGEYIGFFDCDDKIPSNYFESLYRQAIHHNVDIVYTVYNEIWQKNKILKKLKDKISSLRNGALWDKLYKTSLIKENNLSFAEGLYCADNIFVVQAFYFAKNILQTNEPVYQYALNDDSIGKDKSKEEKRKADILTVCKKILNFAENKKLKKTEQNCMKQFLAKSFNEYQEDKTFYQELNNLLNLTNKRKITMHNVVEKHSREIKLFCILPLYGWNKRGGKKVWKILGLPVFKIRKMANGITTKYYVLNIPVLKVSRKTI